MLLNDILRRFVCKNMLIIIVLRHNLKYYYYILFYHYDLKFENVFHACERHYQKYDVEKITQYICYK